MPQIPERRQGRQNRQIHQNPYDRQNFGRIESRRHRDFCFASGLRVKLNGPVVLVMLSMQARQASEQHGELQNGDIWQRVPSVLKTCVMFATPSVLTGENMPDECGEIEIDGQLG
jgi:hypothetical protein